MAWRRRRHELMLITGAGGFLGRHLVAAAEHTDWDLVTPTSGVLDVQHRARVLDAIRDWKPSVVVHLAYRVDDRGTIVDGSRNVAEAAAAAGAHLVHLSTDVVFAGRPEPYRETDAVDAVDGYGRWKADAEAAVQQAHPTAVLVRTSLMYGTDHRSNGQRDVADALAGRGNTTFFTDEYRCPAHATDVAAGVITLASRRDVRGPLHVAGPQVVSRADLAVAFARFTGDDPAGLHTAPRGEQHSHRAGTVVLDCTVAAELGIRCRSLEEGLRRPTA